MKTAFQIFLAILAIVAFMSVVSDAFSIKNPPQGFRDFCKGQSVSECLDALENNCLLGYAKACATMEKFGIPK
ncbi:hypothetical protein CYMTET_36468 [Cymbomonas tetramitiformis]|uniref:Uncharacterized protein n=1 Tax=Cymbomonas tetramitiformis TaxID=36881 RepID=A0AAE0F6Z2_9CHLO|nr:hypothetical protein CYMTET_36468 [Cymbomonas tetramitiformis]